GARQGGDPGELLEEVEQQALAGEQRARGTLDLAEHVSRQGAGTVVDGEANPHVTDPAEYPLDQWQPADDEGLLREQPAARAGGRRNEGLRRAISRAQILEQRQLEERLDARIVEGVGHAGAASAGAKRTTSKRPSVRTVRGSSWCCSTRAAA